MVKQMGANINYNETVENNVTVTTQQDRVGGTITDLVKQFTRQGIEEAQRIYKDYNK